MDSKTLNTRIRQRIDTTANWTTNNSTVLANGEFGLERTTSGNIKIKVGDGNHSWAELSYISTSDDNNSSNLIILEKKFVQPIDNYTVKADLSNQTASTWENDNFSETNALKLINLIEDNTAICYLNSSEIELDKYIFNDPTVLGLDADDSCHSLAYNVSLATFGQNDSEKPYYLLIIIHINKGNNYILSLYTNLTPQDAPSEWIIYKKSLNKDILIDNSINQNSNNLVTSGTIYETIANLNLFSGNYSDLIGSPTLATVATSGSYNDLTNKPTLFSGSYNDLTNKPTLFSGSYNDLTNKPTNVSSFINDAGYLTSNIKILEKVFNQIIDGYLTSNSIFPNQTVSYWSINPYPAENALKLINLIKNENVIYYLNSSEIELEKQITQDDSNTSLYYNFDLSTYSPSDDTKPYYIINILYQAGYNKYSLQFYTNLTPQDAPAEWIIYKKSLNKDILIDNSINQNSNNLVTSATVYNSINSLGIEDINMGDHLIISGGNATSFSTI